MGRKMRDGLLGIHVQTMENRRTRARLLCHMLPFLPIPHGKVSGCCRARRGSHRQTRKEVRKSKVSAQITLCIPSTDWCLIHAATELIRGEDLGNEV